MSNKESIQICWNAAETFDYLPVESLAARSVNARELFEALAPQEQKLFRLLGNSASKGEVVLKIDGVDYEAQALRLSDQERHIDDWYVVDTEKEPVVLFHGDLVFDVIPV